MDYHETVDYLYSRLPYFTRDGKAAYKSDLNNTIALCEIIGNPQNNFKTIHIAGTNGKGSVSHMLSAILQTHGFKTGLYTSPHLKDFRERIKINGVMLEPEFVVDFVENIRPHIEDIQPSFFELTVAMCFAYFSEQKVDYAVIETGLGGRLDSTNIINPILSVITNIGMDHADFLGNTIEQIASEKAGIIKQNTPVVIGESNHAIDSIFREKAKNMLADIFFADQNASYYNTDIETDLKGWYQQKNSITVMQAVDLLKSKNVALETFKVAKALMNVKELTGFSGRWEILSKKPLTIADVAHNAHGLQIVFEQLSSESYQRLHIVFGMLKDKDKKEILALLPKSAHYYFCQPNLPRALPAKELAQACENIGLLGKAYPDIQTALKSAQANANSEDLIFIGGSIFVVAEIL